MNINQLFQLSSTVFTIPEILQSVPGTTSANIANILSHAVKTKKIIRLSRGLYAKPNFNLMEYANKRYSPSYIGFETVLRQANMIFQYSETIQCASYVSRSFTVLSHTVEYFRLPETILNNPQGVIYTDGYAIAIKERAWLDVLYAWKSYHCDSLAPLDFSVVASLLPIYSSKILIKRVERIQKQLEASIKGV